MTTIRTVWNGTPQESLELCDIVSKYCSCGMGDTADATCCASHWMLLADQRALDGLVFARRIRLRLRREEFEIEGWVPQAALWGTAPAGL